MMREMGGLSVKSFWAECENQLFAVAGSDTTRYEQVVHAVRALADDLRRIDSAEALMEAWGNAADMLTAAAEAKGIPVAMLPMDKVAGAAFAMRDREISEESQRKASVAKIEAARAAGETWVVMDEAGDLEAGLFDPYRCTEMHLSTGFALMSMVQTDPETGGPLYILATIKLDRNSGALLDAEPGIADWVEHQSIAEFRATQDDVRSKIRASF